MERSENGGGFRVQGIEADRIVAVGRVEVDDVAAKLGGNDRKSVEGKIALGIDPDAAATGSNLLDDAVEQEGRLAHAGLAEHPKMGEASLVGNVERGQRKSSLAG